MAKVGSSRRAGRSVRRILRRELRAAAWQNRRRIASGLIGWAVTGSAVVIGVRAAGAADWVQGFLAGALLMSLGLLLQAFIQGQGLSHRYMGADAEEWTAAELKKLGKDWRVIHDVHLGVENVDHVVLGRSRLYAVETKWIGSGADYRRLKRYAGQANNRARLLERELLARGVPREVEPLVIAWGPGVKTFAGGDGTYFESERAWLFVGWDAKQWRTWIESTGVGSRVDRPAVEAVRAICEEGPLVSSTSS